uniref:Uncharacterized protein n=1 Tax=Arundo donax TaxID=35708 RepID=A0A0A9H797_ARUDO
MTKSFMLSGAGHIGNVLQFTVKSVRLVRCRFINL